MKRTRLILPFALILLCFTGCDTVLNNFSQVSQHQIDAAKERVQHLSQNLPTLPRSVLLESTEGLDAGQDQMCASIYFAQLFGTDDLSFSEVLDQYTPLAQSAGWQPDLRAERGRTFKTQDESHLEISDNYSLMPFTNSVIEEGQRRFRTLYLVAFNVPIVPSYPVERCK